MMLDGTLQGNSVVHYIYIEIVYLLLVQCTGALVQAVSLLLYIYPRWEAGCMRMMLDGTLHMHYATCMTAFASVSDK